jgi:hypothetical protein
MLKICFTDSIGLNSKSKNEYTFFIGSVIPAELCKYNSASVAGNKIKRFIASLSKNCNVEVLSAYPIATYLTKGLGMRKKNFLYPMSEKIISIRLLIFLLKQILLK